jgi:hypothetical protein
MAVQGCLKPPGGKRGNTPFPAQADWCILLFSRTVKKDIQVLFVPLLRELPAICAVAGSGLPFARLRILHERGNNADKILDFDRHS